MVEFLCIPFLNLLLRSVLQQAWPVLVPQVQGASMMVQVCALLKKCSCVQLCYCDDHVKRKGVKYLKGVPIPCPKCGFEMKETKDLSMSSKCMCLYPRQREYTSSDWCI